jgi:hypothetical protein
MVYIPALSVNVIRLNSRGFFSYSSLNSRNVYPEIRSVDVDKTSLAPIKARKVAEALKVKSGIITSSPGPRSKVVMARKKHQHTIAHKHRVFRSGKVSSLLKEFSGEWPFRNPSCFDSFLRILIIFSSKKRLKLHNFVMHRHFRIC